MTQTVPHTDRALICIHCGYDLRGSTVSARCPECGNDIRDSVRAGAVKGVLPLAWADPRWLNRVALGLLLLCASLVVSYLWLGIVTLTEWNFPGPSVYMRRLVAVPLSLLGVVLIVLPEPRGRFAHHDRTLRILIAALAVGGQLHFIRIVPQLAQQAWVAVVFLLSSWCALLGTLLLFHYVARLAKRAPSRSHVIEARLIALMICVSAVAMSSWRIWRSAGQLDSWAVYGFVEPVLFGIGNRYEAVSLVAHVMFGSYAPMESAFYVTLIASLSAIWAAGFHASLAWTLWRIRRRISSPRAGDSPVPRPIRNG